MYHVMTDGPTAHTERYGHETVAALAQGFPYRRMDAKGRLVAMPEFHELIGDTIVYPVWTGEPIGEEGEE